MSESNGKAFYQLMLKEFPDILDFEQLCTALKVSPKTGYKILQTKKITALKVGRSYRVPKVFVLDFLLAGVQKESKFTNKALESEMLRAIILLSAADGSEGKKEDNYGFRTSDRKKRILLHSIKPV